MDHFRPLCRGFKYLRYFLFQISEVFLLSNIWDVSSFKHLRYFFFSNIWCISFVKYLRYFFFGWCMASACQKFLEKDSSYFEKKKHITISCNVSKYLNWYISDRNWNIQGGRWNFWVEGRWPTGHIDGRRPRWKVLLSFSPAFHMLQKRGEAQQPVITVLYLGAHDLILHSPLTCTDHYVFKIQQREEIYPNVADNYPPEEG